MTNSINNRRTNSFRRKSIGELKKIVEAKTLASAAARFEIARRERTGQGAVEPEAEDQAEA
jgi:hypothetical protein